MSDNKLIEGMDAVNLEVPGTIEEVCKICSRVCVQL